MSAGPANSTSVPVLAGFIPFPTSASSQPQAAASGGSSEGTAAFRGAFPADASSDSRGTFPQRAARQRTSGRFKTRMCHYVLQGKPCPQGTRCSFAHTEGELRRSPCPTAGALPAHGGGEREAGREQRFKTRLCVHWLKSSGAWCPLGSRCRFAHGDEELQAPGSPPKRPAHPPPSTVCVPVQFHGAGEQHRRWTGSAVACDATGSAAAAGQAPPFVASWPQPAAQLVVHTPVPRQTLATPAMQVAGGQEDVEGWGSSAVAATLHSLGIPLQDGESTRGKGGSIWGAPSSPFAM